MSSSNAPVIDAIRHHHDRLAAELRRLTADLLASGPDGWRPALDRLGEWYRTELIPHAVAEEARLFTPAEDKPTTALLVRGLLDEHRHLVSQVAELAMSRDALHACTTAAAAEAVFTGLLRKENDLLLPALDDLGVDLGAVLEGIREFLAGQPANSAGCGCGCDHGHDEVIQIGVRPPAEGGDLDVRALPHGSRHEIIFSRLGALAPGDELVIVNDHDPKPLRYQTSALWPDAFEWSYRESGPERWRVAIKRAG